MPIPSEYDEKLRQLLRIFLAENAKINLSALRTEEACWYGNICDSLAFLEIFGTIHAEPKEHLSLIDIGTGGGFPLLPIALTCPHIACTGLDSIKKKIDAISRIAKEADITMTGIADRAEALGQNKKYREQFDIVTSRAVAPLNILLEYCSSFAKVGGSIVLWKSLHIDEELKASEAAQKALRCPLLKTHVYELPGDFGSRQLLIFQKNGPLDKTYPRPVGMAKKEPI